MLKTEFRDWGINTMQAVGSRLETFSSGDLWVLIERARWCGERSEQLCGPALKKLLQKL